MGLESLDHLKTISKPLCESNIRRVVAGSFFDVGLFVFMSCFGLIRIAK
ncbi:unnamed protein product [Acidithrix sp. C25]|nr:unnamed protein product [Acidithrix sp. C25]